MFKRLAMCSADAPERPIIGVDFNGAQVTDTGLKELPSLKSLQFLSLHATQVTDVGVVESRKVLPKCYIRR
jgi:hypothetical protein